jgi:ubiquitin C-terminal hydrolase
MLILVLQDYYIIKIIIPDVSYFSQNKNAVNLSWKFYDRESYKDKLDFLKEEDSKNIMNYFIDKEIFAKQAITSTNNKSNKSIHTLINEDMIKKIKNEDKNSLYTYYSKSNADKDLVIKQPKDINFELAKRPSFRGLDNVGSFSYMNAILQCLANIKPITDYLLNANKYSEIYNNVALLCPLTLQYCQVLIGLFCNKSNTGSYSPKSFKAVVEEMIPLFQGIQANDSKDLIIFLLEVMNSELSELHNKRNNIKKE